MRKCSEIITFGLIAVLLMLSVTGCRTVRQNAGKMLGDTAKILEDMSDSLQDGTASDSSEAVKDAKEEKNMEKEKDSKLNVETDEAASEEVREGALEESDMYPEGVPKNGLLFASEMKAGWNLGNTLDAYNGYSYLKDDLSTETYWGNPKTTQAMMGDIKAAGFSTIRIPVSWHNHMTFMKGASGRYEVKIDESFMDRVQEIVDWALEEDLFVIINIHHDNDEKYFYPDYAHYDQSVDYVSGVWGAVAQRFKDYDHRLVFEGLNEPRLVGSPYEWWLNKEEQECLDAVAVIQDLNQIFVDTVRATGGNNSDRFLGVTSYCANEDGVLNPDFKLPKDTVEDRIMVAVHAYYPYNFALQGPGEEGSTDSFSTIRESSTIDIDRLVRKLRERYTMKGIPVYLGEFGARDKGGNTKDRAACLTYFVSKLRDAKIPYIVWDNGVFSGSGELFGLYDRRKGTFPEQEVLTALVDNP